MSTGRSTRYASIDLLRFFAASSVLVFHSFPNGYLGGLTRFSFVSYFALRGNIGVDVFFLISGFVILQSARDKSALQFIYSRIIRIYPTLLLVASSIFIYFTITKYSVISVVDYLHAITLTFNMHPNNSFLPQLWTLVYEFKFYLAITLILFLRKSLIQNVISYLLLVFIYVITLVVMVLLGPSRQHIEYKLSRLEDFHLGHFGLLFAIGTLLGVLQKRIKPVEQLILAVTFVVIIVFLFLLKIYASSDWLILILSMAVLAFSKSIHLGNKISNYAFILGGASYPLYLIHYHLTLFMLHKLGHSIFSQEYSFLICYLLTVSLSVYVWRYFERPVQSSLRVRHRNR